MKHGKTHNLKEGHNIFLNINFDSICIEHNGNTFIGYCSNHNKNYCLRCKHFIENNEKIEKELDDEVIKNYEIEMKRNEKIIKEIESMFDDYKKILNDLENNFKTFKDNINKKINFMNEIIEFYKKKKIESDINYQMKANIINNYFDLTEIKQIIQNSLNNQKKKINKLKIFLQNNEIDFKNQEKKINELLIYYFIFIEKFFKQQKI